MVATYSQQQVCFPSFFSLPHSLQWGLELGPEMHFLAIWHCTCHPRNKSKSSSLGNSKKMTSCFDFFFFLNLWKISLTLRIILVWKVVHAGWELVLATSFGFLGFGLGGVTYLKLWRSVGWPQPRPFRQVSCSLCSTLLPCFSSSLFPWLPFLFFLFTQLACWSACLMMNSLHGYNDLSVSWQGQA